MLVGLKVFMDAHKPVTLEEGDRYPLGPPSYVSVVLTAARQSPKLLVGVQIPPGTPNNLLGSSIGLGHCPFTAGRGVRFPYRVPNNVGVAERPIATDCKSVKP